MSSYSFEILVINFVISLSMVKNRNCFAIVICKYIKYIHIISGKEIWSAEEGIDTFFKKVIQYHNLSRSIVLDRDICFTEQFGQILLQKCKIKSHIIAVYHLTTDGQMEKINQTMKIILRCLLTDLYKKSWPDLISEMKRALNMLRNIRIDIISFEVLYKYSSNYCLISISNISEIQNFIKYGEFVRKDLEDIMKLINTQITTYFDSKYKPLVFQEKIFVKLIKTERKEYQLSKNSKLSTIRMRLYDIKRGIDELVYELNLSDHIRIHFIISCIHLKQYIEDNYQRTLSKSLPIIMDKEAEWIMDKLLKERDIRENRKILIKGHNFETEQNTGKSYDRLKKNISDILKIFKNRLKKDRSKKICNKIDEYI